MSYEDSPLQGCPDCDEEYDLPTKDDWETLELVCKKCGSVYNFTQEIHYRKEYIKKVDPIKFMSKKEKEKEQQKRDEELKEKYGERWGLHKVRQKSKIDVFVK